MHKTKINTISANFKGQDILSLDQFDTSSIKKLFSVVPKMARIAQQQKPSNLLRGKIVTLLFYEPSSRTFGSFSAAVKRLGGQTLDILDPQRVSSVSKGETLEDTVRVFETYSDAIVIRHPEKGSVKKAADAAKFVPIISGGDGIGEHPTQALFDLYTINENKGRLNNLTGVIAGDLLNGRTVHSLIRGLSLFRGNTIYLLSPKKLKLKNDDFNNFSARGIKLIEIEKEKDMPKNADFWYWTRVQKERFSSRKEYDSVKNTFILTPKLIELYAGKKTIFLHPLPRVGEIDTAVDKDKRAKYLNHQIKNGVYVRMALLALIFGAI